MGRGIDGCPTRDGPGDFSAACISKVVGRFEFPQAHGAPYGLLGASRTGLTHSAPPALKPQLDPQPSFSVVLSLKDQALPTESGAPTRKHMAHARASTARILPLDH